MKKGFLLFALSMSVIFSHAQSFKKVFIKDSINNSGCYLYSWCDFQFKTEYSQDSSLVFESLCEKDGFNYGVINIKLHQAFENLDQAQESMIRYLDYLKTSFKITLSAGYGKGHRLNSNENTCGVIDYWADSDKNNWKIKGWTNGKYIGILYVYSTKELPELKLNIYLDSFRFPDF
jgi:hypothetical protein